MKLLGLSFAFAIILMSSFCVVDAFWKSKKKTGSKWRSRFTRAVACEIEYLYIKTCDFETSRRGNQRIHAVYHTSCNVKNKEFTFFYKRVNGGPQLSKKTNIPLLTFKDIKQTYEAKNVFLESGSYSMYVSMSAKTLKNVALNKASIECKFYIKPENPTPIYSGGYTRTTRPGEPFKVNASLSMNNDLGKQDVGLFYKWSCTDLMGMCKGRDLGTASYSRIKAKDVKEGNQIIFTVGVRTATSDWMEKKQLYYVNGSRPYSVNCLWHCGLQPGTLNPVLSPTIGISCHYGCTYPYRDVDGILYTETGERVKTLAKMTLFYGHLTGSDMKPNTTMRIELIFRDTKEYAGEYSFYVLPFPVLDNCKVIPPKGNPLTKFKVDCDYVKNDVRNIEIEVKSNGKVTHTGSGKDLDKMNFLVTRDSSVTVELENKERVTKKQKLKVEVEPIIADPTVGVSKVKNHLMDIYNGKEVGTVGVELLTSMGKSAEALQVIDVIAQELSKVQINNKEDRDAMIALKKKLLHDIAKLPIDTPNMGKSVAAVSSLIANQHKEAGSNNDLAKILTETCREAAKKQIEQVENDLEDEISIQDLNDTTNYLMECASNELAVDYGMFNHTETEIEVSTKYPLNPDLSEGIYEEYPNYKSEEIIEVKKHDFLHAASHMIGICHDMAQTFAYKVSVEDLDPTIIDRNTTSLQVFKSEAKKVAQTTFKHFGITVVPSPSLAEMDTVVSAKLCFFKDNPFWALSSVMNPTGVVEISLTDEIEQVPLTSFKKPMNISFQLKSAMIHPHFTIGNITSYDRYVPYPEDDFTIFCIEVKAEENFMMDFNHLTDSDQLEVLIVSMQRPVLKDFSVSHYVTKNDSKMFITHPETYDEWFFLGVRPGPKMDPETSMQVNFTIYTPRCMKWIEYERTWKFACSIYITTTPEEIHCYCLSLSIVTAFIDYNDARVYPKFIEVKFHLPERGSLLILSIVCLILATYFLLIVYTVKKNDALENAVYFLADVPAENRFGYLIFIKTGRKLGSGTTSNVMLQLYGKRSQSQTHILNYPDPLLQFLQRDEEDLFVLGTPIHLGELYQMDLWFDCTGISPSWYCDVIKICDMQTREWYHFHVKEWFQLKETPRIFMYVYVVTDEEMLAKETSKKRRLLDSFFDFGRCSKTSWAFTTRATDPNFSFFKRLTVLLSATLTVMMVALLFHGTSEFLPRDSITPDCDYMFKWSFVLVALIANVVTYIPHLALMELFKRSRTELHQRTSKKEKTLPLVVTLILWVVLIANVILQTHGLLIYGYRIIAPTNWQWLTSVVISMILYIFVLDYLYNMIAIIMGKAKKATNFDLKKILRTVEIQRKHLYKFYGRYIYRPILSRVYAFMTKIEYLEKKIYYKQRREVYWQVQDLFMIIAFLLLLYVIVNTQRDATYAVTGNAEANKLVNGYASAKIKLKDVTNIESFEEFIQHTFIPNIQSYVWYGRYVADNPGMTADFNIRYLGIIRMRQHRVDPDSCQDIAMMRFLKRPCRSGNYFFQHDYLNYTPAWNDTIPYYHDSRLGSIWGYTDGLGASHYGVAGHYKSGGYIGPLGRTPRNSYVNFDYMILRNWLDPWTRAVMVEVPLYNSNRNIFHFVQMVMEKTPGGYIHTKTSVRTEGMMRTTTAAHIFYLICSSIFMIIVLFLCVQTIIRIAKTRIKYSRDLWHVMDLGISILSFFWIYVFFKRQAILQVFIRELEEQQSNIFLEYYEMAELESMVMILSAILIAASIVRTWRLLRYAIIFHTVARAFAYSLPSILVLFLYYCICLTALGIVAYIALGTNVRQFKDFYNALKYLTLVSWDLSDHVDLDYSQNEHGLGYVIIILWYLYTIINIIILIAIVMVEYIKAQQFTFEQKVRYNFKDFTIEKFYTLKRLYRVWIRGLRLHAGGEEREEMVTPKSYDTRYLHCVSTDSNRMKAMESVAKCVLLKHLKKNRTDKSDHLQMLETVNNLHNKETGNKELFFTHVTDESRVQLVDDRRILMMEKIVKRMLETEEQKMERLDKEDVLREDNSARIASIKHKMQNILDVVEKIKIEHVED